MSIFVTDFKYGMDRRRARVAGIPGTLWLGKNVHISRGGDIERPKRFVSTYTLPAGQTFGLTAIKGQLYVFGSAASPSVPVGVQYQRLQSPDASAMVEVLDARAVSGKPYVVARFASGHIYHFYDGTIISDWSTVADGNSDLAATAAYLADIINANSQVSASASGAAITVIAKTPGTGFTITKATTNNSGTNDQEIALSTVQANVAAATETRATGYVIVSGTRGSITSVAVNGVALLSAAVTFVENVASTALAVAAAINRNTETHGYTAATVGGTITLTAAAGTGATVNDHTVAATCVGDVLLTTGNVLGGVSASAAVAQIVTATLTGTFDATDQFTLTINGTAYIATPRAAGMGTSVIVHKRRAWSTANSLLEYSKLNTFNNFSDAGVASGAGFINVSTDAEGSERLVGLGTYQDQLAVFSRRNIRLYNTSTDATLVTFDRPIDNSGTVSARSILSYGSIDTFYLDETGFRSIRAREQNAQAFVNDTGTAIDPFVREHMDSLPNATLQRAVSGIEPREGRFWCALGERLYVLSFFPQSEISAWTYYEPGFSITDIARAYNRIYVRAADTIYLYGGANGNDYPIAGEMPATVQLPYFSTSPPKRDQMLYFGIACTNEWHLQALLDPNNEHAVVEAGRVNGSTYNAGPIDFPGRSSHVALTLTCSAAGAATISNLALSGRGKDEPRG